MAAVRRFTGLPGLGLPGAARAQGTGSKQEFSSGHFFTSLMVHYCFTGARSRLFTVLRPARVAGALLIALA